MVARNREHEPADEHADHADDEAETQKGDGKPTQKQDAESEEAEQRSSPSGAVVYKAICHEGDDELKRPTSALAWSGLAAGLSMGFSLVTEGVLRAHLPDAPWRPLIAKLGYSIGFLIVILGRQQLFTENTLTVILPLLSHRDGKTLWNVARLWATVLGANIVGALIFAAVISHTRLFDSDVREAFDQIGRAAFQSSFGVTLLRGIFAGWLIALMVWLLPFAESFRVLVIIIITYVVGIGDFSHVIAGAVDTLYVTCRGEVTIGRWFLGFMIPTFIGNVIGGVALVAALGHAQVVAGDHGADL
jgi:formate-nitrite transporter family protein